MTSKATENECFVYITLPGQTDFVTAGKFVLATNRRGNPTGKFVYGKKYLETRIRFLQTRSN
jgi:serine/threonine-protein kinase HipA